MAGPTASILIPKTIDEETRVITSKVLAGFAATVEKSDFWIKERPFFLRYGEEYPGALSELEWLKSRLNWSSLDELGLAAMCNQEEDHQLLGQLSLRLAEQLQGLVGCGGSLSNFTDDPEILNHTEIFRRDSEDVLTVNSFRDWLNHPDFRMVK
jgi:hypothetical protein